MTVELITGHAGSAHVSSADAGWFNAGVVGDGKYVLDTGTKFACEVQSANLVTVGTGDAIFEGRHVRVSATENVSIDNGAQGMNRNDIICIKYEYTSGTGVETASLYVIKGTASSGTASDPTIPSGSILTGSTTAYMPLWRIPISGITVGTPVKLYGDLIVPLGDLATDTWDVSQIPSLPASKVTSGTFDINRIPTITNDKIQSVSPAKISGALNAAQVPSMPWVQLKTWTGSAQQSWSNTLYSEILIMAGHGTDYTGSVILPASHFTGTARKVYLSGSYNGSGVLGRAFAVTISSTTVQASIANIDGTDVVASTTWWIYGR